MPPNAYQPPQASSPGAPQYPGFSSLIDPNTGLLQSQYQVQAANPLSYNAQAGNVAQDYSGINLNTQPLQNLEGYASSTGPSQWAQLAQAQNLQSQGALNTQAANQAAGSTAGAQDQLAMRGGLSSGARERVATAGQGNLANSMQGVSNQTQANALGISLQDAQQKQATALQLPGMEVQSLNPALQVAGANAAAQTSDAQTQLAQSNANRQYNTGVQSMNIAGAMGQNAQLNQSNLNAYNTAMGGYAAQQQANATAASGSSGKK